MKKKLPKLLSSYRPAPPNFARRQTGTRSGPLSDLAAWGISCLATMGEAGRRLHVSREVNQTSRNYQVGCNRLLPRFTLLKVIFFYRCDTDATEMRHASSDCVVIVRYIACNAREWRRIFSTINQHFQQYRVEQRQRGKPDAHNAWRQVLEQSVGYGLGHPVLPRHDKPARVCRTPLFGKWHAARFGDDGD